PHSTGITGTRESSSGQRRIGSSGAAAKECGSFALFHSGARSEEPNHSVASEGNLADRDELLTE
ncbi:unnamed protein product, partial [Amoebophrya sp. A25]